MSDPARTRTGPEDGDEDDGPPPRSPGDVLAPGYRVVAHLRRGHDLDVYDVWSETRECRCIAKTARPDLLHTHSARARVLREGRLLLRLTHPHIVRAYEVVTAPLPLVILETLPGETLAHLIDRSGKRLPALEIAQLGLHLCSAVGYLHRNDILHLDLKPANIIATQGLAKLLDLSLARAPGPHRGGIGTPGYMAPEQVAGGNLGFHTDVWGLGATLYEVATVVPACDAEDESTGAAWNRARDACTPLPVRRGRRLPASLANAIDHCLNQEPDNRPTVRELGQRLEEFVRSTS